MSSRKQRAAIAEETVAIMQRGSYELPESRTISIAESLERAKDGTKVYNPQSFRHVFAQIEKQEKQTIFRVENCTTFAGARGLLDEDPTRDVLCLNFASAKNAGGGFLGGSQAQEESLARASGLYACIAPMREYYDTNRNCRTALYTHHMIYSPGVPVFRDDADRLLEDHYAVSILTAPAVNAGAVRKNEPHREHEIESVMRERIERALAVACVHGHDALVLGAWGCGVFRNDPEDIAEWFHDHLIHDPRFRGTFGTVFFAVLDRTHDEQNITPFRRLFGR